MAAETPREELIAFLRAQEVPEQDIAAADARGFVALQLLASETLLIGGSQRYTSRQVAELAGVEQDLADRFWRALGFPDVPDDEPVFTEADVKMLSAAGAMIQLGVSDAEVALQVTRVMGLSLARVAEAQMDALRETIEPAARDLGISEEEVAVRTVQLSTQILPTLEEFLLYTWRRHLADAARRHTVAHFTEGGDSAIRMVVGFVDMVGFTALSQQLEDREIGRIVSRFESIAYDTVAACGGRVVKWIGDEVMFVAEDVVNAAEIALRLVEAHDAAEDLPEVSVGLSSGTVLPREGDYLGPTVNLASRTVAVARPGTVVVSEAVRDELRASETDRFVWRPLRPRMLKGIGRVRLWKLARAIPGEVVTEEYDDADEPRERVARTRDEIHDVLEGARDLVERVGEPLQKIEETVERVRGRRRSARTPRPGTP